MKENSKGKKGWIYAQRGKLHAMALDLCLEELSVCQALGVLVGRYGVASVYAAACAEMVAGDVLEHWERTLKGADAHAGRDDE